MLNELQYKSPFLREFNLHISFMDGIFDGIKIKPIDTGCNHVKRFDVFKHVRFKESSR